MEFEESDEDNLMSIYGELLKEDDDMMRKNFLRSAKARKKEEKHPFLRYGTGIQNYFAMQERLIKLFCALTIIAIPQILIYRYFEGFKNDYKDDAGQRFAELSFGNMGYSGYTCGKNFINWADRTTTTVMLQCQGTTRIRNVIDSGVVDIGQSGETERLNEFNRCFYNRTHDA